MSLSFFKVLLAETLFRKEEVTLIIKGEHEIEKITMKKEELDEGLEIETKIVRTLADKHIDHIKKQ